MASQATGSGSGAPDLGSAESAATGCQESAVVRAERSSVTVSRRDSSARTRKTCHGRPGTGQGNDRTMGNVMSAWRTPRCPHGRYRILTPAGCWLLQRRIRYRVRRERVSCFHWKRRGRKCEVRGAIGDREAMSDFRVLECAAARWPRRRRSADPGAHGERRDVRLRVPEDPRPGARRRRLMLT